MTMFFRITLLFALAAAIITVVPVSTRTAFAQLCQYWAQCW
jgi:hypothetical protein